MTSAPEALRGLARSDYGRAVALLARQCGDFHAAEEAVQGAFDAAAASWPERGVPQDPRHWLLGAARDLLRRNHPAAPDETDGAPEADPGECEDAPAREASARGKDHADDPADDHADDDETGHLLDLALFCSHPALSAEAQVVLTLRYLAGLTAAEIAAAFGTTEEDVLTRLSSAREDIGTAALVFESPGPPDRAARLTTALDVVYLIYNEGYVPGEQGPVRAILCEEACRLARELVRLLPDDPETLGLAALILLLEARRPARVDAGAGLVSLAAQDRSRWDAWLIAEARRLVQECVRIGAPGPYQLNATIQAVHAAATGEDDTDWGQIMALYDQLTALTSSPAVAASRAVAVAHVLGPEAGLAAAQAIPWSHPAVTQVRAELMARLGRSDEAAVLGSLGLNRPAPGEPEPGGLLGYGDALLP